MSKETPDKIENQVFSVDDWDEESMYEDKLNEIERTNLEDVPVEKIMLRVETIVTDNPSLGGSVMEWNKEIWIEILRNVLKGQLYDQYE